MSEVDRNGTTGDTVRAKRGVHIKMTNPEEAGSDHRLVGKARVLRSVMETRRSVRFFDPRPIPREVVEACIAVAGSAPSGANMQPWSFVLITDKILKKNIREQAERIEMEFYSRRISEEWKARLEPLGTNEKKEFLEQAPYLICIFVQKYGVDENGDRVTHYYPRESVGIATGFLIAALHQLGICSLPYTPAPMTFLTELLSRPENERPFLILAVGYPDENRTNPSIEKKKLRDFLTIL